MVAHGKDGGPCSDDQCACSTMTLDEIRAKQQADLDEVGFYMHYITDDGSTHTHGLPHTYGHPDLEIRVPVGPGVAGKIMWTVVDRIKAGEKFKHGDILENVLSGDFKVKLIDATECGRHVLRIILPPKSGTLERDEMPLEWQEQFN